MNLMNLVKIDREIKALEALRTRVTQTVNPSQVLLREIDKKLHELLNPKDENEATQPQTSQQTKK